VQADQISLLEQIHCNVPEHQNLVPPLGENLGQGD
jgi:hypothetical protein